MIKKTKEMRWRILVLSAFFFGLTFWYFTPMSLAADTTAPTTPANLIATTISSSQINLFWTASTDDVGVTGYKIYRCAGSACAPTVQIATSAVNSYSNTGLTASTAYTYAVSAYDAAGNESEKSQTISAITQNLSSSQIALYDVYEISLTSLGNYTNPYTLMPGDSTTPGFVTATFTGPNSQNITIDGFWDGGNIWKIRMAPIAIGVWSYITSSTDRGLNGKTGSFLVVSSLNKGFVKLNPANPHHFMWDDGTPFFFSSVATMVSHFDTRDAQGDNRSVDNNTFQTLADTRKDQGFTTTHWGYFGFNKPQFNDKTQANEGGAPFTNYNSDFLNPLYHQYGDLRVKALLDRGIVPQFQLGWPDQGIWTNIGVNIR